LTVQEELERALEKVLSRKVKVEASGRTDAGVHALAQVAHFCANKSVDPFRLRGSLNALLPPDIAVLSIEKASGRFHARFDASQKTYQYFVILRPVKSVFSLPGYAIPYAPDVKRMRAEAKVLLGRHDFRSFQGADRLPRSSVTTLHEISVRHIRPQGVPFLAGETALLFEIKGSGFLRSMVRNIVGTLLDIGRGKIKKGELKVILAAKDRRKAGFCAPARGLFLSEVNYE
jgi:tRNA pseudouridine38-40 synthase